MSKPEVIPFEEVDRRAVDPLDPRLPRNLTSTRPQMIDSACLKLVDRLAQNEFGFGRALPTRGPVSERPRHLIGPAADSTKLNLLPGSLSSGLFFANSTAWSEWPLGLTES